MKNQEEHNDQFAVDDGSLYLLTGLAIVVGLIVVSYITFISLAQSFLK